MDTCHSIDLCVHMPSTTAIMPPDFAPKCWSWVAGLWRWLDLLLFTVKVASCSFLRNQTTERLCQSSKAVKSVISALSCLPKMCEREREKCSEESHYHLQLNTLFLFHCPFLASPRSIEQAIIIVKIKLAWTIE